MKNEDTIALSYGWGIGFIVDMRGRTARGMWKGPNRTWPADWTKSWEEREGRRKRDERWAREEPDEETKNKRAHGLKEEPQEPRVAEPI